MKGLRSGRLKEATDKLADIFAAPGAKYKDCEKALRSVKPWQGARYSRTRFLRWLFKAEGIAVEPSPDDWEVLTGMGSGVEKGLAAAENLKQGALEACRIVSDELWPDSGVVCGLDDLVCLLCLSQSKEA
eukprot:5755028-Pyramimonas_sp.AAC.1